MVTPAAFVSIPPDVPLVKRGRGDGGHFGLVHTCLKVKAATALQS